LAEKGKDENAVDSSYLFIKLVMLAPKTKSKGVVLVQINYDTAKVDKIESIYGPQVQYTQTLTSESPWSDFFDFITEKKFKSQFVRNATQDLQATASKVLGANNFDSAIIKDVIKFHDKKKFSNIYEMFYHELCRVLYDKELELMIGTEFVLQHEIDSHYAEKSKIADAEKKDLDENVAAVDDFFSPDPDRIYIDSSPMVAPVSGIPIFNLRAGMEIMVKINNTTSIGNKYNTYFNLIDEDGKISPIRSTVEKLKTDSEGHKILVHIKDNIYGKIIETEQVKVKLHQEAEDIQIDDSTDEKSLIMKLLPVIGVAAAIILLIILYILFVS
jgi:hypothetical protein